MSNNMKAVIALLISIWIIGSIIYVYTPYQVLGADIQFGVLGFWIGWTCRGTTLEDSSKEPKS